MKWLKTYEVSLHLLDLYFDGVQGIAKELSLFRNWKRHVGPGRRLNETEVRVRTLGRWKLSNWDCLRNVEIALANSVFGLGWGDKRFVSE